MPEVRLCGRVFKGRHVNRVCFLKALTSGQASSLLHPAASDRDFPVHLKIRRSPARAVGGLALALCLSACGMSAPSAASGQAAGAAATSGASADSNPSLPVVQAYQADSFVDSIGVVTHLSYTDTPYFTAWPGVYNALQALGVRHVRDGYYDWNPSSPFIEEHQQLAAAGIHTDYVVPYNTSTTAEDIEQFSSGAGDMESLEAPNECDVPGNCGPTAASGIANMIAFMPTINAAGQQIGVPVLGPSFTQPASYPMAGNIASLMTYNNLHVYFGGRNPGSTGWGDLDNEGHAYGCFAWWLDQANIDAPNVPSIVTESGYMSYPQTTTPFTLPESVEASYTPRTLLLAYKAGIKRTFLYELLDEQSSPGYGLMHNDLTPKPAYLAVQNLIANLWDKGPSFTPGQLAYSVQGGDSTLNQMLFQKRDGSFWLVLWLEQSSYDPAAAAPTPVTPQAVTVTMDSAYVAPNIGVFDNTGKLNWTSAQPASSAVPLTVSDQLTIVKILHQ